MISIALLIGVRIIPNPLYFAFVLLIIFFAAGGFAAISIIFASFMKTRERFMGIGQAIILPLFFLSNALYPVKLMSEIFQYIAAYNPMSYVVDTVRGLLITGDLSNIILDMIVIAIFDIVMFTLASKSFKKIIE